MMMPAMFADAFRQTPAPTSAPVTVSCPDCGLTVPQEAKFCPHCGHQLLIFQKCAVCGKNLPPNAKFCGQCGRPAEEKPQDKKCPHCAAANLPGAVFCNQCGERM